MSELSTKDLMGKIQNNLIITLLENEILCPECKGLRFVLIESNNKSYIESCRHCYTGKLFVCKHCNKGYKSRCECREATDERNTEYQIKKAQKELEAYQKAEKIQYKDYKGKFIVEDSEYIKDCEDLEEWLYERISEGKDVPEYLWACESNRHFSIDLKDVISDKCEDGYEEMYNNLDTGSPLLSQAQELIEQWENEQGDSLCMYNETYKKAVVLKELIDEIIKEV